MATVTKDASAKVVSLERAGYKPRTDDESEAWAGARERMRVLLETTDLAERLAEAFEREEMKERGEPLPPSTRKPFEPLKSR